jgi:hypothetical protein
MPEPSAKKGSVLEEEEPFGPAYAVHVCYGRGAGVVVVVGDAGACSSGTIGAAEPGAGDVAAGTGICDGWSSTDCGARFRDDIIASTKQRKRKIPPAHQLAAVRKFPA